MATCMTWWRTLGILVLLTTAAGAQEIEHVGDHPTGVPLRTRDFTVPAFQLLGFAPAPAASLGRGTWGIEVHLSKVNNFQVSQTVEEYLGATRSEGERRRLDAADAAYIIGLPEGEGFYIDLETDIADVTVHYGLTDRLDVGLTANYFRYDGGILDTPVEEFHDAFGFGQQGRLSVERHRSQIVIGRDGEAFRMTLDNPSEGGFGDPFLYLRYAIPGDLGGWRFNVAGGAKPPLASAEDALSSGEWDFGLQLTADRRWSRNALILNLATVAAGDYQVRTGSVETDMPLLVTVHASWIHLLRGPSHTRLFLQLLFAEHPLRDLVDSDLTQLEFQLTAGVKWDSRIGTWGIGLTENLFNMDNTPDIGAHLSWGTVLR